MKEKVKATATDYAATKVNNRSNRRRIEFLLALTLTGALACTSQTTERGKSSAALSEEKKTDGANITPLGTGPSYAPPVDSEAVEVPTNIAGSFLTCALRKEASDTDLNQQYGCFLGEAGSGKKVDQDPLLTWQSSTAAGVEFLAPDSDYTVSLYNTLVVVTGATKGEIDQKVLSADVIAMYGLKAVTVKKLYNVLKPAYDIKDFEAPILRDQTIEPNRDGSPVDPF